MFEDWLKQHFMVDDELIYFGNGLAANKAVFLAVFGPRADAALASGKSLYEALSVDARGWQPMFDEWKARGIVQ